MIQYTLTSTSQSLIIPYTKFLTVISKSTNSNKDNKNCDCQKPETCPMDRNCNVESIIYQAEITSQTTRETYTGLCDTPFKLRYRNHTSSFHNERYRNATELSKHVWNLKDQNIHYNIKWHKIKQARSYSNVSKQCNLCLGEKYFILSKPEMPSLNNQNKLTNCKCRAADILGNFVEKLSLN